MLLPNGHAFQMPSQNLMDKNFTFKDVRFTQTPRTWLSLTIFEAGNFTAVIGAITK